MGKAPKGDHSFQPGGAGKGDADRTTDVQSFRANYDNINWHSIRTFKDGSCWCAVYNDAFINLQESPSGWGDTPKEAEDDLKTNHGERPYLEQERNGIIEGVDDRPLHYNAKDGTITTLDLRGKRWLGWPLTGHKRSWIERND